MPFSYIKEVILLKKYKLKLVFSRKLQKFWDKQRNLPDSAISVFSKNRENNGIFPLFVFRYLDKALQYLSCPIFRKFSRQVPQLSDFRSCTVLVRQSRCCATKVKLRYNYRGLSHSYSVFSIFNNQNVYFSDLKERLVQTHSRESF